MLKNLKFEIKNPEHCELVQEVLFKNGYKWAGTESESKNIQNLHADMLTCYSNGLIFYACNSDEYDSTFIEHKNTAAKIELHYVIVEKNVVKVGDVLYYEDEVIEALKDIKPIK